MSKPTIFFSHSSKDKDVISAIKNKVVQYTGNTIEIFQSSDGESIPFGTNWIHKVEEGLENAKIMFVFVTENSISSGGVESQIVCWADKIAYLAHDWEEFVAVDLLDVMLSRINKIIIQLDEFVRNKTDKKYEYLSDEEKNLLSGMWMMTARISERVFRQRQRRKFSRR